MSSNAPMSKSHLPGLTRVHAGKVRDVYAVDDRTLLLVATDRISAFDCVLPTVIPRKGSVLTQLSAFWFDRLKGIAANHLITTDLGSMPESIRSIPELGGRSSLVHRTQVFPVECVVRGYLEGSGWKDYQETGTVCGHDLPAGLRHCDRLDEPLFTPATKAGAGHDQNISFNEFSTLVGSDTAEHLRRLSLSLYSTASKYAANRGIIIADTKFEFGMSIDGSILLIDEVLTPDSSRFWPADSYKAGGPQASFDKQYVREYLETLDWNKRPPAPALPAEVVSATTERYLTAYELLAGRPLPDR